MDMAVVGFGPAYECRTESLIGDTDWPRVNAGLEPRGFGHKKHKRTQKTGGPSGSWALHQLLLQRLEGVAVLAVLHGPAGGGQFFAHGVGAAEVLGLLRGPALLGKGGNRGGNLRFGSSCSLQTETESKHHSGECLEEASSMLRKNASRDGIDIAE